MSRQIRRNELHRHRVRRHKLKKLRRRYADVRTSAERERILQKVMRVAPSITSEQFVAPLKAKQ